jgi:hypothetical protein
LLRPVTGHLDRMGTLRKPFAHYDHRRENNGPKLLNQAHLSRARHA